MKIKGKPKFSQVFMAIMVAVAGAAAIALIMSNAARAGEMQTTWTAPTKNCDGTPLTDLAGYKLRWGQGKIDTPASQLGYTVMGLTPGDWWVSVASFNALGAESQFITVTKTIAPADFKVIEPTAYTVVKGTDKFIFLPVGTVPVGTGCDATQPVNRYHVVSRASVTWSGSVKPVVVVAVCG